MNKKLIISLHLIFWITYSGFLAGYLLLEAEDINYVYFPAVVLVRRIYDLMIFYYFYYTISPKLLNTKKIILYIFLSLLFIGVLAIPFTYITVYNSNRWYSPITDYSSYNKDYFITLLYHAFLIIPFGIAFKLGKLWYDNFITQKILKAQSDANELALLRSQINPHFLFNTLNNIHSFIRREPDKASFGIIKLSDIMRYMLYKSDTEKVLLENEIEYINNYIELQKLRTSDTNFVKFNITGNYQGVWVPPLLFVPFVENAFKHGKKRGVSPGITINLSVLNNKIDFSITNYIKEEKNVDNTKGGFGLKNIKRRLELLFGDKYELETSVEENKFIVKLKITLNEDKLHSH
jgi:two-component system, LytTR family, sensor kinase